MPDDFLAISAGLTRWTASHDAHVRAAVDLLLWHEHWIRRADFRKACLVIDRDDAWIRWSEAREFCDSRPRASTSELAILDLAVTLGEDRFRLGIMGNSHRQAIADAVRSAVGL